MSSAVSLLINDVLRICQAGAMEQITALLSYRATVERNHHLNRVCHAHISSLRMVYLQKC